MSKLARICFPFYGDTVGGSHRSALLLIDALDPHQFEPVIVLHQEGVLSEYLAAHGRAYFLLPLRGPVHGGPKFPELLIRLASATSRILAFLKREHISLVHSNDLRSAQTWALPTRLANLPLVWHQRTKYAPSRITRLGLSLATRIVCISEFCRGTLPARAADLASVIQNPFDTSVVSSDRADARKIVMAAIGADPADLLVGFCGTLSVQKRPDIFIQAAAHIRAGTRRRVRFVVVGLDRDKRQSELESQAVSAGVGGLVTFVGYQQDVVRWLASFDVLLVPQFDDAFGRTLVEAMLVGTPVVASATGGHPEIIADGENGLLTPKDDAEAMARAGLRVLEEPDLAGKYREAGQRWCLETVGVEGHVSAIQGVYQEVLV